MCARISQGSHCSASSAPPHRSLRFAGLMVRLEALVLRQTLLALTPPSSCGSAGRDGSLSLPIRGPCLAGLELV